MDKPIDIDPRSNAVNEWVEKYREVKPLILEAPANHLKSANSRIITSGLQEYSGEWTEKQTKHLLSRTLFGVTKSALDNFKNKTMSEAVNEIVAVSPEPAPPVNDYEGLGGAKDPHVGFGESWLNAPHGGSNEGLRVVSLKGWLIKNMLIQQDTIHEKLVLFWSNLLVTKVWDVYMAKASYQYFKMIYENALGNYKVFIKKLTLNPAMLNFLNGAKNTKDAPDENYGRELQELFCIGKGPGSKYTEHDVQEAARVLTGWRIDYSAYENEGQFSSYFDYNKHDRRNKRFSEFYGNRLIEGKYQMKGADELDELLDMLFENAETAKYLCRRIYSFFVYNDINETVEKNIIEPLAQIFRESNYELEPVFKTLFKSEHFYDAMNYGVLIKSPVDHTLGLWRTLGMKTPDDGDLVKDYQKHRSILWQMAGLGMEIGDPPNVAGWTAYYQAPQFDKAWITTTTITKRAATTDSMLYWGYWIAQGRQIKADLLAFVDTLDEPSDPNLLIHESATLLLGIELGNELVKILKSSLLSGQQTDYYWTQAWSNYKNNPGNALYKGIVENRLKSTFKQMLQLGEQQLM